MLKEDYCYNWILRFLVVGLSFSFYVSFYFLVLEDIIGITWEHSVCASCYLNDTEFLVLRWQEVLSMPIYNPE